jgi:hypothetical protein
MKPKETRIMDPRQHEVPALACILDAIPETERPAHFALVSRLFGERAYEKMDLPNGHSFRFPADAFDELAQFVSKERRCCPFLAFDIVVPPGDGPVSLRLTGPDGTREFSCGGTAGYVTPVVLRGYGLCSGPALCRERGGDRSGLRASLKRAE